MRLLGTAAGAETWGYGSGPERVDLVVLAKGEFSGLRVGSLRWYRSTGCRLAHGWILLASPLSTIYHRCTVSHYSRTCARCILYLIYCISRVSDVYNTEAVNSAVRNNVSTIYNSPPVETLPSAKQSNIYQPTLLRLRDRPRTLTNRIIPLEPPSTRYLYIHISNIVISTQLSTLG